MTTVKHMVDAFETKAVANADTQRELTMPPRVSALWARSTVRWGWPHPSMGERRAHRRGRGLKDGDRDEELEHGDSQRVAPGAEVVTVEGSTGDMTRA